MKFEYFFVYRYLLQSSGRRLVPIVSLVTVCGIAFATIALLLAMAIISGFEKHYETSLLSFDSHISVSLPDSVQDWSDFGRELEAIVAKDQIRGLVPVIYHEALLVHGSEVRGVAIKAVPLDEYWNLSGLVKQSNQAGASEQASLWIGKALWEELGVGAQDLKLTLPNQDKGFKKLYPAGFFSTGMYEYDSAFALMSIRQVETVFGVHEAPSRVEIWLADPMRADLIRDQLLDQLPSGYHAVSWQELHAHLFGALKLERLVFSLIMALLLLVACFNVASSLIMKILEKRSDIAILRSMGVRWAQLKRLFVMQGVLLGVCGCLLGFLIAQGILWWIDAVHPIALEAKIYFVDAVPIHQEIGQFGMVFMTSVLFSWASSLLALRRLKSLSIVQGLTEV